MHTLITATATLLLAGAHAGPPSGQPGPAPRTATLEHLRTIVIDPGHGGDNRGCLGVDGTWEKVAVLRIAQRVERILLEETSAAVLLTRRDDVALGLRERTRLANAWGADVFLSIHLNADAFGRGEGVETWFVAADDDDDEAARVVATEEAAYGESDAPDAFLGDPVRDLVRAASVGASRAASMALAETVVAGLHRHTEARVRGVKQARFGVLIEAEMPAIVVECGFFSHAVEGQRLRDDAYQERVARGIVEGLIAYDRRLGSPPTLEELARAR